MSKECYGYDIALPVWNKIKDVKMVFINGNLVSEGRTHKTSEYDKYQAKKVLNSLFKKR